MATQTVQTVSDIPAALAPFFTKEDTGLIPRGTAEIFRSFGQRYDPLISAGLTGAGTVAPLSAMQQRVGTRLEGLGLPGAFTQAQQAGQTALGSFGDISNVTAPGLQQFQLDPTRQFSAEEMQTYMSPYMQGVVDVQQRKAIEDAQRAQLGQNLAAARQGTYGGARQTLAQAQREAGLRTQLGDIQAQGLQSAFQQAQQQFGADRAAQMAAEQENLRAALGIQQFGAGQSLEAQRANQAAQQAAAQQNLAAQLGVQQFGAGQSLEAQRANQAAQLQGAQGLAGLAQTLGGLGTQQLAGELDITKTIGAYGDLQRAQAQQELDARRQYAQQQAEYGLSQVGDLSNLLRGIPLTDTTKTATTPPPSFASQLTGLGLTGIGLYNLLGGGR
jgi:hypothetical protein